MSGSLFTDTRKRAEEVRQWADLNGGELEWLIGDETVREAVEKALWLAPDVERLAERLERIEKVLTKPNGAITNDWYYRVQSEALQIARGE